MSNVKIVVITGASRGLGLTLAKEFDANGWQVVGNGRSKQPADFPQNGAYYQFDASSPAECEDFWKQLHGKQPEAQICLVNNAGGYVSGSLTGSKPEDFEQQMRSSYFSSVYMTRGLALVYPSAKMINIVSSSALAAHRNNAAYGAAKAAQMHFFQALQDEFRPKQYQITNVYPGDIATHGGNPEAISPRDLAVFIRQQAENSGSYYLRDVTIYPS